MQFFNASVWIMKCLMLQQKCSLSDVTAKVLSLNVLYYTIIIISTRDGAVCITVVKLKSANCLVDFKVSIAYIPVKLIIICAASLEVPQ